jgi:hypothetical protein
MSSRKKTDTKVLAIPQSEAQKLLEWLVNWPAEPDDNLSLSEYRRLRESGEAPASPEYRRDWAYWHYRARRMTRNYWPDLWRNEPQALMLLRMEQRYLQEFWRTQDPHARDWYMHRARELFYRHQIQSRVGSLQAELNAASTADEARRLASRINSVMESSLDQPPLRTPFEESLFYLQKLAEWVRICQNPQCKHMPYFIAEDKRRKYCCEECGWLADKKAKRESRERHPEWEEKRRSERKRTK